MCNRLTENKRLSSEGLVYRLKIKGLKEAMSCIQL